MTLGSEGSQPAEGGQKSRSKGKQDSPGKACADLVVWCSFTSPRCRRDLLYGDGAPRWTRPTRQAWFDAFVMCLLSCIALCLFRAVTSKRRWVRFPGGSGGWGGDCWWRMWGWGEWFGICFPWGWSSFRALLFPSCPPYRLFCGRQRGF